MSKVAIIGAGPAGLVSARYLKSEGFEPVIFDRGRSVGGQWSGDPRCSSVWPSMRTNTTRILTAFSDFPHAPGTHVYPRNQDVLAYLTRYAETHGLMPQVRTETRVERIRRENGLWTIESRAAEGPPVRETFTHVVLATGRYQKPFMPDVPGLASFSGESGAIHTKAYKDPERYRGKRVLVAGCAISALEVASDLAMLGAARVLTTNRKQRYVLPKLCAGVPTDHTAFSRFGGLAAEHLPLDAVAAAFKAFVLRIAGNPEQFGAPRPADNILEAGVSLCQHYLPLVAEGRITIRPWMAGVSGQRVTFADGTEEEVDALICGTGYVLRLGPAGRRAVPPVSMRTRSTSIRTSSRFIRTSQASRSSVSSIRSDRSFPCWSNRRDGSPTRGVERGRCRRRVRCGRAWKPTAPGVIFRRWCPMHTTARIFAGEAGVEPDVREWPDLVRPLLFGPLTPISYRLSGRDCRADARECSSQRCRGVRCRSVIAAAAGTVHPASDAGCRAARSRLRRIRRPDHGRGVANFIFP